VKPTDGGRLQAQSNLTLFNSVVWGTCNTNTPSDQCNTNMGWFAGQMQASCKTELANADPVVGAALTGLQAYALMRTAACTTNPLTDTYCLVDAVRAPTASDVYYFGLPLGTPLPTSTAPTCSACTKSLLGLYAPYAPAANSKLATNATAALPALGNSVYAQAAGAANKACGQDFAASAQGSGARALRPAAAVMTAAFVLLAAGVVW
jgi:hypothetical protein